MCGFLFLHLILHKVTETNAVTLKIPTVFL